MNVTKRVIALCIGALGALLISQPVLASGPPQPASGLVVITKFLPNSIRHADGNTIIEGSDQASITGTFSGINVAHFTLTNHPDGSFEDHEIGVFTGHVAGCGTGSVPFNGVISGMAGAVPHGSVAGIDQVNNTAGVVFEVKLTGLPSGATAYSGNYHCTG